MSIPPNEFLSEWNVQEFYNLVKLHSWEAHASDEYRKIMGAKYAQGK